MELKNQVEALATLRQFASANRHVVLISGVKGCGKTFLAKRYAELLGINDFFVLSSKIDELREFMDHEYLGDVKRVICIENIDTGVVGVSNAILKFIEEPTDNLYIVITCRNLSAVLDTIKSRCVPVHVPQMYIDDIKSYAKDRLQIDTGKYSYDLWKCVSSIEDVEKLSKLNESQILHLKSSADLVGSSMPVASLVWKLSNYPDGSPTDITLMIKYLMLNTTSALVFYACHDCLSDLDLGRISPHAILSKLCFTLKYIR